MENHESKAKDFFTYTIIWHYIGLLIFGLLLIAVIFSSELSDLLFSDKFKHRGEYFTKVILPLAAAVITIVGVILTIKRTNALIQQSKAMECSTIELKRQNNKLQIRFEQEHVENRFNVAIEHLGHDSFSIALSGVYELHQVAIENEKYRNLIFNILCSYVKQNTKHALREGENDNWTKLSAIDKKKVRPELIIQTIFDLIFQNNNKNIYTNYQADLSHTNLRGINLTGMSFNRTKFDNSFIDGSSMFTDENHNTTFTECSFHKVHITGINASKSTFINCDFSYSLMCWNNFYGCTFEQCNFSGADMTCAILSQATIISSNFYKACLEGVEMYQPNFKVTSNVTQFKETSLAFASLFDGSNLYNNDKIYICNSNITGVQTNNTYYKGHTRINRLLEYGPNAKTSNIMTFAINPINDSKNEKKIFARIIEKVIKYAYGNNIEEIFTDKDIEKLKLLLSSQALN